MGRTEATFRRRSQPRTIIQTLRDPEGHPLCKTLHDNQITVSDDPRLAEIQAIVRDCKLTALEAEARTAKALALKAAKAVETVEINSLEGIAAAQTFRCNLWPSVSPSIVPALEAARRGERLVVSEETKKYVEQLKLLM